MSKKDLLAEAHALGLDVSEKDTVAEIESAIAQHAAETAQAHEDDTGPVALRVQAVPHDSGYVELQFGSVVPNEDEEPAFETVSSVLVSGEDALGLVDSLPGVVQVARNAATHVG